MKQSNSITAKVMLIFLLLFSPFAFAQDSEVTDQMLEPQVQLTREEVIRFEADKVQLEREFVMNLQKLDTKLFCLAQNNFFEARGESLLGKIAISQVVLNRTENPKYPHDVCAVVKQSTPATKPGPLKNVCQFSWACMGLGRIPLLRRNGEVNDKVYRQWYDSVVAAMLAVQGKVDSIVGNATHFYNQKQVKPNWPGMQKVEVIGNHTFMAPRDQ